MNTANDYDSDGNNIVPCLICLSVHCPSNDGGECPEVKDFLRGAPYSPDWEKIRKEVDKRVDSLHPNNFTEGDVDNESWEHDCKALKESITSLLQAREEWLRGEIERLIPEGTDEIVGAYWLKGRLLHLLTPKN